MISVTMNEKHDSHNCCEDELAHSFFGAVTVGERGQIVIPAEARNELGLRAGDKMLVMRHPLHKGLMIFKFDSVRGFIDEFANYLKNVDGAEPQEDEG